ncbi:MAG TPA: SDR family NAD(P)-dependent oxidoreductase [Rhodopila sp.]|uniref:type I polyketide synthase n=1 Tax=Rhodopila sp. TaxID=2480087 RepID=UPI002BB45AD3|nr:SDR family NAD(P)-dependent oxidoreductase [Rhodopila sp.]HVY15657.1 SDR family NAD(P)-dependent oxidoreductase [Rhodopila sp.]
MSGSAAEQLDRARRVIADLRKRLTDAQNAGGDAIAVVGMACRFPGEARDCDGFWRMVEAGRDAIRPVPPHRARDMGEGTLKPVALLDDIETFDAAFFDISPREAVQMDPQQRLFLEVAWEALEDAGQTRAGLAGSQTGTFVGVHNHSAGYLELQTADTSRCNEYTALGSGHDVIAGRLAYVLDLRGPSAVINTACSSSLVAVHMACQSLLSRDCRMAVAGGVNLILGPMQNRIVNLGAMLAPDGRCKTFDARANGYGRGEGCGAVVLKRLSDAMADRDRVLAVIRGSAINQDGRTNGLTAPNGLSQQDLLRCTLAKTGMPASRIGYVEAHGTGTALGDPIEVEALASVYGAVQDGAARCALGSAKANINHLEGAAGVAGLIKTILALRARVIPPVAGFDTLNPHLSLEGTRLFVPAEATAWHADTPRVAAVSAFGWSGVNAHVILEEATDAPPAAAPRPTMMMVSAVDETTLSDRAAALAAALETLPEESLEDFAWTATARRTHYPHRIAVVAETRAAMIRALQTGTGEPKGTAPIRFLIGDDTKAARTFGPELLRDDDVFRTAIARCAAAFEACGDKGTSFGLLDDFANVGTDAQVFAFSIGIAAVLGQLGVHTGPVTGSGVGALAAACIREDMTLNDAVRRIVGRSAYVVAGGPPPQAGTARIVRLDRCLMDDETGAEAGSVRSRLMHILAGCVASGHPLNWDAVFSPTARLVSLPAHPFRRRRHWIVEAPAVPPVVAAHAPDDWFYETAWQPEVLAVSPPAAVRWLILGEADGVAGRLAALVRARHGVAMVEAGRPALVMDPARWVVVDLRALDRRDGAADGLASDLVDLDKALGRMPADRDVRLWVVTRGAQHLPGDGVGNLVAAPLWGLGRSLLLDHPERWGGLIDLDPAAPFDADALYQEVAAAAKEAEEVALRGGTRFVNRVMPAAAPPSGAPAFDPAACYLVTGAFGGVGPSLATWLADHGARSLVLAGRSLGDAGHPSEALRQRLRDRGVDVRLERCDVGDRSSVAALFDRIRQAGVPLRGLFHAAAAASLPVEDIGDADIVAAFRPKVVGGRLLDEYSRPFPLDHFVLFSSAAGVLGARGQGHYAGANAFLDALAASRRAEGLPGLSVAWGLWAAENGAHVPYFQRAGLDPMDHGAALDAMARLMMAQVDGRRDAHPVIASMDGDRLRVALEGRGRARFLSALAPQAPVATSGGNPALLDHLRQAPAPLRHGMVVDLVAKQVRAVMELPEDDPLDSERGFFDLGMDSLMTVALKARLEELFGIALPSTLAMDFPSVEALAGYFTGLVSGTPETMDMPVPAAASVPVRDVEMLADDEVGDALAAELRALEALE